MTRENCIAQLSHEVNTQGAAKGWIEHDEHAGLVLHAWSWRISGYHPNKDVFVEHVLENVSRVLENCRCIGESKWHCQTFIMADTNQLVGLAEIKFGEYGHSLEEFEGGGDQRQKVTVLDGDTVEPMIVDTRS